MIRFNTDKGAGKVLCNTLRQIALTKRYVVRPIAFKVGDSSNILSAGNLVIEDMIEFSSSLTGLDYELNRPITQEDHNRIIECNYNCTGVLTVRDLSQGEIVVTSEDKLNDEILHLVQLSGGTKASTTVTVFYRIAEGAADKNDNEYFLSKELSGTLINGSDGIDNSIVILSSRHTDVASFAYTISQTSLDHDSVQCKIETLNSTSEKDVLIDACDTLGSLLASVKAQTT